MSSIDHDEGSSDKTSELAGLPLATFDATTCAQLHNEIVRRAAALDPELSPLLIENAFEVHDTTMHHPHDPDSPIADYLSESLISFLTQIVTRKDGQMDTPRIVPFFQPPDVGLLYGYGDALWNEENPYMIWLYRDIDSASGGGIYLDQTTGLAHSFNHQFYRTPSAENWMRLEDILKNWLMMFDTGKIAYGHVFDDTEGPQGLITKRWADFDRDELLAAWENLLSTIVSRMPIASLSSVQGDKGQGRWSHEDLERHHVPQGPLYDFLALAQKPPPVPSPQGLRIAPATCLIDPSMTDATFLPPRADPRYRYHLFLPLVITPNPGSHDTTTPLMYTGGFYLQPAAPDFPEVIHYISPDIAPNGMSDLGDNSIQHNKQNNIFDPVDSDAQQVPCPWNPRRMPSITDFFRLWTQLIVDGVWSVDANGVTGDYDVLEATGRGPGRMNWTDIGG